MFQAIIIASLQDCESNLQSSEDLYCCQADRELLGHSDIKTTLRYTHAIKKLIIKIQSPPDVIMSKNNTRLLDS